MMTIYRKNVQMNHELMESFLHDIKTSGKSENTIKNYRIDIRNFLDYIGDALLNHVTFENASDYRLFLLEEKELKAASVNRKMSSAKSMFNYLSEMKYIEHNPFKEIESIKVKEEEKFQPRILTEEEVNLLLWTIENSSPYNREYSSSFVIKRDLLLVNLMLRVGLRVNETIELTHRQINFENNTIRVGGKYKARVLSFEEVIKNLYFEYIKECEYRFNFMREDTPVLVSINGNKLFESDVLARIVKYCDIAGINDLKKYENRVTPDSIRYAFAKFSVSNE